MKEKRSLISAQTISSSHPSRSLTRNPFLLPFRAKVNCRQHNGRQYLSNKRARLFYERQSRFVGRRAVFFLISPFSLLLALLRIFALWHLPLSLVTLSSRTAGDAGRTNGFCRMNASLTRISSGSKVGRGVLSCVHYRRDSTGCVVHASTICSQNPQFLFPRFAHIIISIYYIPFQDRAKLIPIYLLHL